MRRLRPQRVRPLGVRAIALGASWALTATLIAPLGRDAPLLTASGIAFSGLLLALGLRSAAADELSMSGILLAAVYARSSLFAEGTDEWAPLVAISLFTFLAAANAYHDGHLDTQVGFWAARVRAGLTWLAVAVGVASVTAAAGAVDSGEPRLVWLLGLAGVVLLLTLVASLARVGSISSSEGP